MTVFFYSHSKTIQPFLIRRSTVLGISLQQDSLVVNRGFYRYKTFMFISHSARDGMNSIPRPQVDGLSVPPRVYREIAYLNFFSYFFIGYGWHAGAVSSYPLVMSFLPRQPALQMTSFLVCIKVTNPSLHKHWFQHLHSTLTVRYHFRIEQSRV